MKILITGGAGFIGSAVVRRAIADGHQVVNLDALTYSANLDNVASVADAAGYAFEHVDVCDRPALEGVFARHQPTLVAVSTPGLIFAEVPVLRTATRHGVPSIAVDLSWDNLTNKLFPIRRVDRLVVWNSTMRREAHELHGYPLEDISVAGPP